MHKHDEAPPLNPWPFLAGDAVLLATAFLIASQAEAPLSGLPLIIIALCVGLGAMLAVIPFVLNHTRRQDVALAERQREIAALAQTTASSAEQISIAAAGLHSLSEHVARALKLGESLPHKMQDKINDFKAQLNEVAVTENEALSQEINTLRTSETERLETALTGVRKVVAELAALETATRKNLRELNDSLAKHSAETLKAANEASSAIMSARDTAEQSLATAQAKALAAFQAAAGSLLAARDGRPTQHTSGPTQPALDTGHSTPPVPAPNIPDTTSARHTQPGLQPTKAANPRTPAADTRPPTPAAHTTTPEPVPAGPAIATAEPPAGAATAPSLVPAKHPGKKPARKPADTSNELDLGIDFQTDQDFSQTSPEESAPALSADGLTRLIVTAYIGIGNRLHVRGEGAGLSWDRGVPLQFVSIGKWRWESSEASGPVKLKLYKNDAQECTSLGTLTLASGHQQEVTASFG